MDRHVAQEVVDVHGVLQVVPLRNVFQGLDHPLVVGLVRLGDLAVPDRLVAVQVIVGVVEVCAAAVPVHAARRLPVAEVFAVAHVFRFSAAHVHALRLIEFPALCAVVAELEAVLHALQGQVNAPIFPVE